MAIMVQTWVSCNDFLDVSPRGTEKAEDVYATQSGFRNVLNGVYMQLSDANLYGKNTSYYLPELLARHWTLPSDNFSDNTYIVPNYNFANYNGNSFFTSVWQSYYKAVAQLNNLLEELDKTDVKFSDDTEHFIRAEALGLRAFIHLEVLRYWGPAPLVAMSETPAVPYVTEMTFETQKLLTLPWMEVAEKIRKDLDAAQALLKQYDLIQNVSASNLNSTSTSGGGKLEDLWFHFRQNRFNYYAVLATKARLYNWMKADPAYPLAAKDSAAYYAAEVINAVNAESGQKQFEFTTSLNLATNGLNMSGECIFALHNPLLQDVIQTAFKDNPPQLTQSTANLDVAYEAAANANDLRYGSITTGRYWQSVYVPNIGTFNRFMKYADDSRTTYGTTLTRNQIPVVRLSEMYFILIENTDNISTVKNTFRTFQQARNFSLSSISSLATPVDVLNKLEKEYRKEFYGEGQMFFFYKKQGYVSFTYPDAFSLPQGLESYRLPLPKSQQQFE
jgi:hypothetical protein